MSTEIRILLFPIIKYDRRSDAEFVENNVYDTLIPFDDDVLVYTLNDFSSLCNDQEFDIESYWVSYIRYIKH